MPSVNRCLDIASHRKKSGFHHGGQLFAGPPSPPNFNVVWICVGHLQNTFRQSRRRFSWGDIVFNIEIGGRGGNRAEHPKRDWVFTCEILSVNSPPAHHFFEKKLSMPGELLLLARVFPSTLGMAPYFFFVKIRSWGIIFPGHPRHLCSNTFHWKRIKLNCGRLLRFGVSLDLWKPTKMVTGCPWTSEKAKKCRAAYYRGSGCPSTSEKQHKMVTGVPGPLKKWKNCRATYYRGSGCLWTSKKQQKTVTGCPWTSEKSENNCRATYYRGSGVSLHLWKTTKNGHGVSLDLWKNEKNGRAT